MPDPLVGKRHDPHACSSCEGMAPTQRRRHWKIERPQGVWHYLADGPDLMARLPRSAHFITVLAYLPGPDGLPAHYHGPFYLEGDGALPDVIRDLRRSVEFAHVGYDLPAEAIRLSLSGGRSIHMTIPAHVIGADEGHPQLPDIYKAMVETLFPKAMAPTLDRGIYSRGKGRMWRLPNRRRTDTGKYKVPISVSELLHTSPTDLEALTAKPRKGLFWPPEHDLNPSEKSQIDQLYRIVLEAMTNSAKHAKGNIISVQIGKLEDGAVEINICDDGCGNGGPFSWANGIPAMFARAETIGVTVNFERTSECGGTKVRIRLDVEGGKPVP